LSEEELVPKFELVCRTQPKTYVIFNFRYGMISNQQPSITTGLRGFELCRSGSYGTKPRLAFPCTVVPWQTQSTLAKMIASLHDENNHITIPGFMTMLRNYLLKKRAEMAKAPFA
jgi:hypothetical protein